MRVFGPVTVMIVLSVSAHAQTKPELPPNTIDCNGFQKQPNGSWYAKADNPSFDFGNMKQMTLTKATFGAHTLSLDGYDLAAALDVKCGSQQK